MKQVTKYRNTQGRPLHPSVDRESFTTFAAKFGITPDQIEPFTAYELEDGDRVTIEKCVGYVTDEDGISTGGRWVDITGIWRCLPGTDRVGALEDDEGRFIQSMGCEMDYNNFPYRNVRLASA